MLGQMQEDIRGANDLLRPFSAKGVKQIQINYMKKELYPYSWDWFLWPGSNG